MYANTQRSKNSTNTVMEIINNDKFLYTTKRTCWKCSWVFLPSHIPEDAWILSREITHLSNTIRNKWQWLFPCIQNNRQKQLRNNSNICLVFEMRANFDLLFFGLHKCEISTSSSIKKNCRSILPFYYFKLLDFRSYLPVIEFELFWNIWDQGPKQKKYFGFYRDLCENQIIKDYLKDH